MLVNLHKKMSSAMEELSKISRFCWWFYVFSAYRQHSNKLFDVLYDAKVVNFLFVWHIFYNPQTTASTAKHRQEDELKFVNLIKEEMQTYLSQQSLKGLNKQLSIKNLKWTTLILGYSVSTNSSEALRSIFRQSTLRSRERKC